MSSLRVVTVASNKGGVGKTTIATNLAVYLRALREELPILVLGLDDQDVIQRMFALDASAPAEADVLEATADGICDSLLAIVYERRFRPEEKVHQPWIDRQWGKVERALDQLEKTMPRLGKKPHGGHFALAAMLRYIELRFAGKWQKGRPKLKRYLSRFEAVFPDYAKFKD